MSEDNGKPVIAGDAVIWNDLNESVAEHLRAAFAEGIGTSWEIYYEDSDKDDNGVEWLKGCVFAGTCIVETPAYGPNRTRLLAIAEELNKTNQELESMPDKEAVQVENENTKVEPKAEAANTANDVQTLQTDISSALDFLSTMYQGLYEMLDSSYELESQLAVTDMSAIAEQFGKLIGGIQKRFDSLKTQADSAQAAQAELTQLKQQQADAEAAVTLKSRTEALAELGINIEDRKDFYLGLSVDTFDLYVSDLKLVKSNHKVASASSVVAIPEPNTSGNDGLSIKELAKALNTRG
jgi:hypothetical protein